MNARGIVVVALVLGALSGCSSPSGTGFRLLVPATWFSGSESRKVERTETKLDKAEGVLLREAQKTAHETQIALGSAELSRPVEVAKESNDTTVSALDQLAGPLTVEESNLLRARVAGLLSEVAAERAKAEHEREGRRAVMASASDTIDGLRGELKTANAKLKEGFERENALANEYRAIKFWVYVAIGAWIFVAFILPILGRAFPVVGAVASVGQSIVAPFAVAAASGTKRLAGDLVGGIHELREKLKVAPLTKDSADEILKQWITEADGTAAKVDQLRREKHFV